MANCKIRAPHGRTLCIPIWRRYLVLNDIVSVVSKFSKCNQQKITNPLTNERHVVSSYFCIYVSRLLNFDVNDVVLFDIKYFFLLHEVSTFIYVCVCVYIYIYILIIDRLQYLNNKRHQILHQLLKDPPSESVYRISLFRFFVSKTLKLVQQLQIFFFLD